MQAESLPRAARVLAAVALAGLVAACGGGGGGGSPPAAPAPSTVTISGAITYAYVPHGVNGGLNYGQTQYRPVRLVKVQFMDGATVVATTNTDINGNYSLAVPANRTGFIRATASSTQAGAPGWNFSVVDNTKADAPYVLDGTALSSGSANSVRDLQARSGWTGSGYGDPRAAAPFAILDTIYTAAAYIVAVDPTIVFPPLLIHWSTKNIGSVDANGDRNAATGEIETSFYGNSSGFNGIYLLGEENVDSDEYDPHLIVHEFGHYLDLSFGRNESFGGGHRRGDRLDPRTALSEGWPTAYSALALGDPVYIDSGGVQQQSAFGFNIERPPAGFENPARGWYSEESIWELIYDLVDTAADTSDSFAYSFADVWNVLKNTMTTSKALPSIFVFWKGIKDAHVTDSALLDQLTTTQLISPVQDHFGTGESNSAGSPHVLPVYRQVTLNGPAVNLCSIDDFTSASGAVNKLSSRRFVQFTSSITGTATITVTATSIPAGKYADPDFIAHWGQLVSPVGRSSPTAPCEALASGGGSPSVCVETGTVTVVPDTYVVEVYEWTNTNDTTDAFPPIGDVCFDVRVTQP